ncbi:MAG: DinB family protein [Longimicrobiales bacterium]|nr:DinB family protein [Longimicrobiales bacterium]
MPAAHSLLDAVEDMERSVQGLTPEEVWLTPGGAPSIGFHLKHVPGSLERLLAYTRGQALTPGQLAAIPLEGEPGDPPAGPDELLDALRDARDRTLDAYRATDPASLLEPRVVGRSGLPSTVQGLLFHAAEHARRHAGQVVATARIVQGLGPWSDGVPGGGARGGTDPTR